MSADLDLEEIFPQLRAFLARDAKCALVPFLTQIAGEEDEEDQVSEYNKRLEAALGNGAPGPGDAPSGPGVAFVAVAAEGDLASDVRGNLLDLENLVALSIVVNRKKNTTGLTAFQMLRRVLRLVHNQTVAVRGARKEFRLAKPAYNVGPLSKGVTVYFVNLLVRTSEPLGAIDPA